MQSGMTPLIFAAKEGNLDVVRTLVENGRADVNITENVGVFPP
jgi:ankyrin repeat protein